MTGDFLCAFARRTVRPDTYRSVILPAVADLQFEARTRSAWCIARGYAGVWSAVGAGLLHDVGMAVQRPGFVDDARSAAGLVAMQAVYYGCMLSLTVNQTARISTAALVRITAIAVLVSAVPVVALVFSGRERDEAG